jgi:hypothetical protein
VFVIYSVLDLEKALSAWGKSPPADATSTIEMIGVWDPLAYIAVGVNSN